MTASANAHDYAIDWTKRQVDRGSLPVAVFGAATSTGIQELASFGTDDGRSAGVDDRFALFSVSKPLVGLATMRLVERGLLSLDAPLSEVVPTLDGQPAGLATLDHLLSHRSGLAEPPLDAPDARRALEQASAVFPAGTMTQYCNLGFMGVEKFVEQASGQRLDELVEAFNELDGARSLSFDGDGNPHHVHGTEAEGLDFDAMVAERNPAAGVFGTASDLLSVGSALLRTAREGSNEVVHPSTLAAMRVNRTSGLPRLNARPTDALRQDWGLTFNLPQSPAILERTVFGHAGWSGCQWWIYPELDACFVLMTNILNIDEQGVRIDELHNAFVAGLAH